MLEELAVRAERGVEFVRGGGAAFRNAVLALRQGVLPSQILVELGDQAVGYQGLVVAALRAGPDGGRVLTRSLVAWMAQQPTAVLYVATVSDYAVFDPPASVLAPAGASGYWCDLATGEAGVAALGTAEMALSPANAGGEIARGRGGDVGGGTRVECDVRINGVFRLRGSNPEGVRRIAVRSAAVAGLLLSHR
jgi:hypothetical protein